jgi:TonB-linked SusC/RagA family outer membrane protein
MNLITIVRGFYVESRTFFQVIRLSFLLLLLATYGWAVTDSYGQTTEIRISAGEKTLKDLFAEIEQKSEFIFFYNDEAIDLTQKVRVNSNPQKIEDILSQALAGNHVKYEIIDRQIVFHTEAKKASTRNDSPRPQPQQARRQLNGSVVDAHGEPVIGANVLEKGTTNGVITDIDGKFSLTIPEGATLQITYIGYISQEINVRNQQNIRLTLVEDSKNLDEVVVIGYGTRKRSSVSGAIDQVGTEVFEDRPVGNTMQALQGASANLIIQQRSMNPNDNTMNINIRGITSLNNSDPLLVIDGMIASELDALTTNLNPNDIENVSVLKDAGSAAIYGSRAANGVILITTKKGAKNSTPRIRFNAMVGDQVPEILYRPVAGYKNAEYRNLSNETTGLPLTYTTDQIDDLYAHRNEDHWWMDEIYKDAIQQSYNLSVSGGGNNTTFLISAGYYNQGSNIVGNWGVERYNFRTNAGAEWGRFKLNSIMAYNRTMERRSVADLGGINTNAFRVPAYYYYKLKTDDGKYLVNDVVSDGNTLAQLEEGGHQKQDTDNITANLNLEYSLMEGLTAKALAGIDLRQQHRFRRWMQVPLYSENDLDNPIRYINSTRNVDDYNNKYYTLNTQFLLDFNRTFNAVHNVNALLGTSNESYTRQHSMVRLSFMTTTAGAFSPPSWPHTASPKRLS